MRSIEVSANGAKIETAGKPFALEWSLPDADIGYRTTGVKIMRARLIAVFVLLLSAELAAAQPAGPVEPTLTVRGQGVERVPPDHANLTVDVLTKAASPEAATAAHRERASRAVSALRVMKDDGVQIEQSSFALNEVRLPRPQNATQDRDRIEYQATTTFQLKLARVDAVDRAVTALAATGLFEVKNLRFGIEDRNAGLDTARMNAVEDARHRAMTYAQAAGVELGDILRIDDTDGRMPREFAVAAPMARSVQIVPPETVTLEAAITMTWRIGARR